MTPTLKWQDANGESAYLLEIDDDPAFIPPLVYQNPNVTESSTTFTVPTGFLIDGTTYYWRMTATNAFGEAVASSNPSARRLG